jgi:hypothetical protein
MGKVVMTIGIVLVIIGTIGIIVGMVGVPLQFTSTIVQAVTPTAEALCNPGETLDEEHGAEEYTALEGYRRSVRYYCVNDAGERREVTGSFVTGMLGDAFSGLGTLLIPLVGSCFCTVGIFATIFGWLFARRHPLRVATANNFAFPDDNFLGTQTPLSTIPENQRALASKLRQLEDARSAGLISEDEYQRLRREALNDVR